MAIPGLGVSCVWKRRAHFIAHAHSIPLCAQHEKQNQKQHTKHAIIVAIPILCCTTSVKQGSVRTGSTLSRFPPTHGSAANGEWWLMALVTARDIRTPLRQTIDTFSVGAAFPARKMCSSTTSKGTPKTP